MPDVGREGSVVLGALTDSGLDDKGRLAVVVDLFDIDFYRGVVRRHSHRLLHDPGTAARGEGDVLGGQYRKRDVRVSPQALQRTACPVKVDQNPVSSGPQ